jgi:hypothetical protein
MKLFKTLLTILFISLLSSPSWSVTTGDLVERDGLYYEKFTDVPFTGKVTGNPQGSYKNGKKEGAWVFYHENGQLRFKENFKNGELDGAWVSYYENGQLRSKGNFKNGKKDRSWVRYEENGTVQKRLTGMFKDGIKISD